MLLTLTQTEHPLFVLGRGWMGIERLTVGDALATRAGPALVVQSITHQHRAEGYLVYNLTVEGDHTYFVDSAGGGVWAHNTGPCPTQENQIGKYDELIDNSVPHDNLETHHLPQGHPAEQAIPEYDYNTGVAR